MSAGCQHTYNEVARRRLQVREVPAHASRPLRLARQGLPRECLARGAGFASRLRGTRESEARKHKTLPDLYQIIHS